MITYEEFKEAWECVPGSEQCSIYLNFQSENDDCEKWEDFDEEFFEVYFRDNPIEAVRAWHFGGDNNWSDEYIKFNAYGNLVTGTYWDVAKDAQNHLREIYEMPELWCEYIECGDDNDED